MTILQQGYPVGGELVPSELIHRWMRPAKSVSVGISVGRNGYLNAGLNVDGYEIVIGTKTGRVKAFKDIAHLHKSLKKHMQSVSSYSMNFVDAQQVRAPSYTTPAQNAAMALREQVAVSSIKALADKAKVSAANVLTNWKPSLNRDAQIAYYNKFIELGVAADKFIATGVWPVTPPATPAPAPSPTPTPAPAPSANA
jgi:hypothetical protein